LATTDIINRITSTIIEAAIRVHRALGPGLLESAYCACLCYELVRAGLHLETQKALPLVYEGVTIDCAYRADIIINQIVIVEVKAMNYIEPPPSRHPLTY